MADEPVFPFVVGQEVVIICYDYDNPSYAPCTVVKVLKTRVVLSNGSWFGPSLVKSMSAFAPTYRLVAADDPKVTELKAMVRKRRAANAALNAVRRWEVGAGRDLDGTMHDPMPVIRAFVGLLPDGEKRKALEAALDAGLPDARRQ
jgi:hypothetical protein